MADSRQKNDSRFRNNSPLSHQKKSASCWRPGGTSEKDLTMPAWILYSSRYQFRGKVHSCNMPGDRTGCILAKTKFGSSISWMAIYPMDIVRWGTKKVMPGLVWHREGDASIAFILYYSISYKDMYCLPGGADLYILIFLSVTINNGVPKGMRPYSAISHKIKNRQFLVNTQYVTRTHIAFPGLQLNIEKRSVSLIHVTRRIYY